MFVGQRKSSCGYLLMLDGDISARKLMKGSKDYHAVIKLLTVWLTISFQ